MCHRLNDELGEASTQSGCAHAEHWDELVSLASSIDIDLEYVRSMGDKVEALREGVKADDKYDDAHPSTISAFFNGLTYKDARKFLDKIHPSAAGYFAWTIGRFQDEGRSVNEIREKAWDATRGEPKEADPQGSLLPGDGE